MFGIKTKIIKISTDVIFELTEGRLSNEINIRNLMNYFVADEYGHQASIRRADLGYGWVHYGLIRTEKPKRILCIGSRHGFIPAVLAQACKDNEKGYVDFVDPGYGPKDKNHWTGVGLWKKEKGRKLFKDFGLGKWIKIYVMTTEQFAGKSKKMFDYIYIDGDHSYKGVSTDYKLLWPRLRKNGFMVFHDVNVTGTKPEGKYGVNKLWNKITTKGSIEIPFEGSGLGIIQKKS